MVFAVLFNRSLQMSRDAKQRKLGMQNACRGYQVCQFSFIKEIILITYFHKTAWKYKCAFYSIYHHLCMRMRMKHGHNGETTTWLLGLHTTSMVVRNSKAPVALQHIKLRPCCCSCATGSNPGTASQWRND